MGYAEEMAGRLPTGMTLPDEFDALFDWMEVNGFFMASGAYPGDRLGLLGTQDDADSDRITVVLFRIATAEQAGEYGEAWLGTDNATIGKRLVPVARTGGDGSHAAFWLDDDGQQQIVHLGSEGLACLLGRTPLDFLRLLAIGYEEISGDCLTKPDRPPQKVGRNTAYRAWLAQCFGVTIPDTASDILTDVPNVLAETADDPFRRWVREMQNAAD